MKSFGSFSEMVRVANNRDKAFEHKVTVTDVLKYLLDEGYEIGTMKEHHGCLTIELENVTDDMAVDVAYNTVYDNIKWVQVFELDEEEEWDEVTEKYDPNWYDKD